MEMVKKLKLDNGVDRLSSLPDPIRAHILSFLPTKDAVRTGILSNTWRALWTQLPILDFRWLMLPRSLAVNKYFGRRDNDDVLTIRELFYNFLDRAFVSILMLEKLKLYVPGFVPQLKSRVDNWVDCAFGYRLQEFELQLGFDSYEEIRYSLPKTVLSSNLITKLTLINCEVNESSLIDISLPSLCYLSLTYVFITDEAMANLLANCRNLEDFNCDTCYDLHQLEISGLTKLKKAKIKYRYAKRLGIEIEAPSLIELTYECEDLCDNEGYCDFELIDCTNLKKFKAVGAALDDMDLHFLLGDLPALEELHLYYCDCLRFIDISSPRLVHLELIRCEWILKATINAPNLKYFYFEDDKPIELPLRGLTPRLKEASIWLELEDKTDKWYARLVKFFAKFRHCERLVICVGFVKDLIVPQSVRMKTRPPLSGVKHLTVEIRASFKKRTPVSFIEGLLWLAPCLETITIYNSHDQIWKSLELIYEMPLKGQKRCGCWNPLPIHCWRHSINRVSIENKKKEDDDTELANFFRNARIDGKIVEFSSKNSLSEPQKNSSC
ncbi:putative F-box/FBD/LRR-repeat protein At2g05300 [Silene latifolia]|uniref:putative F-box/FBD/LRR-repeat protein At2g05300 n=1 Tax=Silene latifolia TaxID=37657 RepID=UPI003D7724B4